MLRLSFYELVILVGLTACASIGWGHGPGTLPAKQALLDAQTFWDNRDWDWYQKHIPFFDCPDADINTTYYYRWELVTKHLTYGSPNTGYTFTEFIDRPFWSGTYGAISCPAGHQLYEVRWLRDKRFAQDYAKYWFRTPGAQPRRYSCWLADAVWSTHLVHPDRPFVMDLAPDMANNFLAWQKDHFVPEIGLFWQTGHDDGMEININSRQTKDVVRGAPGYRPTLNAYLYADALAIAQAANLAGDAMTRLQFEVRAAALKKSLQQKLWDKKRNFFLHMYKQDEMRDGHLIKALTLTYESGQHAGSPHGREEIGYVPWQFNLPDPGYEAAWKFLMDRDYFYANFGPSTVERHDPMFKLSKTCCWWSGQSWPYATTQTLVALANLLNNYDQKVIDKSDYFKLLQVYTKTHRKDGKPYIAEACHPDTGSWEGHDSYNHSEHYFHSGYVDLIITGLVGLRPRPDNTVEVNPLAPEDWEYFALIDVPYHGHRLSIIWDRTGKKYDLGTGLHILASGKKIATAAKLGKLTAKLPPAAETKDPPLLVNYAVNNDGTYFPRISASHTGPKSAITKVNDGNYWYTPHPPNRWTCEGSAKDSDWCMIDLGTLRKIRALKLYLLDDGNTIVPPARIDVEYWDGKAWQAIPNQKRTPDQPTGKRSNTITFPELETSKVRAVFTHAKPGVSGLSEFEAWGAATLPVAPAPSPKGNLALNTTGAGFPKASASYTSRFDKVAMANDGIVSFSPSPHNRWTAYESPNATDWLEIDFGANKQVGRVDLHLYDDRGGVQPPASYTVQSWDGAIWRDAANQKKSPPAPTGGMVNEVVFPPVSTAKVRIVFTHQGKARSGVTEIEIWKE